MRLIYISPVPWASFSQRPQHFANWYHQQTGEAVLWIEPYPTRLPTLSDLLHRRPDSEQPCVTMPRWLQTVEPRSLPIEPLPGATLLLRHLWGEVFEQVLAFANTGPCCIVIGKPSELALQVLALLPNCLSMYDAMDDFPAFYQGLSQRSMERRQARLLKAVDRVLASSTPLRSKLAKNDVQVELVLNGCDAQHLAPVEQLHLTAKQQILGYVGTLGSWFDWDLVINIARLNPQRRVQLRGPLFVPPPCTLPGNIELLPECPHAEALATMATFSAGLIPFKLNRLTASVDPIKYYEYRAMGLPVISTRFGEMAQREHDSGVWLVDQDTDLARTTDAALAFIDEASSIEAFRRSHLWASRFAAVGLHTLDAHLPEP